jgi:hypothetical protein
MTAGSKILIFRSIFRWFRQKFAAHPWHFILTSILAFYVPAVAIIHVWERVNPLDAAQVVFVLFLGEYGVQPATDVGKIVAIISLFIGVVFLGAIVGQLTSLFVIKKMEAQMPDKFKRLIIICNWNDRGDRVIKELHSPTAAPDAEIVVITEGEINENELRVSSAYEQVFFFRNDPTSYDVMKKLGVHRAENVIILADDKCSDPDAKTALISLAITSHTEEDDELRKPYIVAELIDSCKEQHLMCAGVDECVCASYYRLGIIAQCTLHHKLSEVYHQLLTYSPDTNEIYLLDPEEYPKYFLGEEFRVLAKIINDSTSKDNPTVLLGVKIGETRKIKGEEVEKGSIILNPREKEFDKLRDGDSLIVMAFKQPDLGHIIEK